MEKKIRNDDFLNSLDIIFLQLIVMQIKKTKKNDHVTSGNILFIRTLKA